MARELQTLTLAERNQAFLDAESKVDKAIQIQQGMRQSVWRTMIPRTTYALGEGLQKKAYRFFPGLGHQRGLHLWHAIQISRKASAGDQAFDATKYNPYTVDYGFDSVTYSGLGIEYVTPNISIRDLRFMWELKQQIAAVYGYLGDFTNDMWENYHREMYAYWCNQAGKCYVLADGTPTSSTFTYNPMSSDSDNDNVLTITVSSGYPNVSILNWNYFKWFSRYLQMQATTAAIGNRDGRPLYGWIGDLEDFDRMIEENPRLREDWRHYNAQMLIKNYGNTTEYKGYTLMHDMLTPRFAVKSTDGTTLTLKRIDPKSSSAASLIGNRADVNTDYLNAEFGTVFLYLKNVFQTEIPPAGPASAGSGVSFGASPDLNGNWKWINIPDPVHNPLGEIGYWFMRAEAFSKPLAWREEPIMILYRRFVHQLALDTELGGSDAAAEQGIAVDAVSGDIDTDNNTISLTLEGFLTAEAGQQIVLTDDDGTTDNGIIADSSAAPTYLLALESAPSAFGKYTQAGSSKVTVS
jgi:hypothetical protein